MFRKKQRRSRSRRQFKKTAGRQHKANFKGPVMRGGIRL